MKFDDIDPGALEQARRLYMDGGASVADIAATLNLDARRFYELRRARGWPLRKPQPAASRRKGAAPKPKRPARSPSRPVAPPPPVTQDVSAPPVDSGELERRLAHAVSRELATFEGRAPDSATGTDRNARILSSLARTLAELRKLEAAPAGRGKRQGQPHAGQPERPPRDLATLREELARKLAEYRQSREAE